LIKKIFAKTTNIPLNPIRDNVFLPKKLVRLIEGMSRDAEIMNIEPAMAVIGNRRKLPYVPRTKKTTGYNLNGPSFRLNVANKHVAVSRSKKMFRYGFIFFKKIGEVAMRFPKR
jgi:hypothetical protein